MRVENVSIVSSFRKSPNTNLMIQTLAQFYNTTEHLMRVLPILRRNSPVSLRILDWFIVNYANEKQTVYEISGGRQFDVYASYKEQLQTFSKKMFDPFRRKARIYLDLGGTEGIETTVGQLCFFRWCLQNGVVDYVEAHLSEINQHMRESLSSEDQTLVNGSSDTTVGSVEKIEKKRSRKRGGRKSKVSAKKTATFVATRGSSKGKYVVEWD